MKAHLCVLFILVLIGCAATPNQGQFADNTFSCDYPELTVRILKKVVRQREGSQQGKGYIRTSHSYMTESGEFVGISVWRFRPASSEGWGTRDEEIILDIGMVPLDPVEINNQTWIKFVDLKNEKYVAFGYFKRVDSNLVAVYRVGNMEEVKDELESINYKSALSTNQKLILTRAFDANASLFVIE